MVFPRTSLVNFSRCEEDLLPSDTNSAESPPYSTGHLLVRSTRPDVVRQDFPLRSSLTPCHVGKFFAHPVSNWLPSHVFFLFFPSFFVPTKRLMIDLSSLICLALLFFFRVCLRLRNLTTAQSAASEIPACPLSSTFFVFRRSKISALFPSRRRFRWVPPSQVHRP